MTISRQLRQQTKSLMAERDEKGFERIINSIQPVVQGTAASVADDKVVQKKAAGGVEFALGVKDIVIKQQNAGLDKFQGNGHDTGKLEQIKEHELRVLKSIAAKQEAMNSYASDVAALAGNVVEGFAAKLERGNLGLVKTTVTKVPRETHHDEARDALY